MTEKPYAFHTGLKEIKLEPVEIASLLVKRINQQPCPVVYPAGCNIDQVGKKYPLI